MILLTQGSEHFQMLSLSFKRPLGLQANLFGLDLIITVNQILTKLETFRHTVLILVLSICVDSKKIDFIFIKVSGQKNL